MSTFSPAMNISWYEAKNICISYNATLLSFSSHNNIVTVQAFMWEILSDALPLPIFLGLKKDFTVSIQRDSFVSPVVI